jgi:hypothetical protein
VLGAAALTASAAAPAAAAPAALPGHGPRTAVTFDRDVLRGLARLGVRVRAVDAEQQGRGDRLTVVFRVTGTDHGTVQHRGGIVLDSPRRPDLVLERPTFDLRRGTVSVAVGRGGRQRVTLLTATGARGGATSHDADRGGRDQGGRDQGGQDRNGQEQGRQGSRPAGDAQGNRPAAGNQPANQQGTPQAPQTTAPAPAPRGQGGGQLAPGGGGTSALGPNDDYSADLRLTGDGERLLDRALDTRWFHAGMRIGSAEFALR